MNSFPVLLQAHSFQVLRSVILGGFVFIWNQLICPWHLDINTVKSDSVSAKLPELTYVSIRTVPFADHVLLCCCSLTWHHYLVVFSYSITYAEESHFLIHHLLCSGHKIPEYLRAGQNLLFFLSRKKYVKNMWQKYREEFLNFHIGTVAKFS